MNGEYVGVSMSCLHQTLEFIVFFFLFQTGCNGSIRMDSFFNRFINRDWLMVFHIVPPPEKPAIRNDLGATSIA